MNSQLEDAAWLSLLLRLSLGPRSARQPGQEAEAVVELQHVAHFGPEVSGEALEQAVLSQVVIQQLQEHEACTRQQSQHEVSARAHISVRPLHVNPFVHRKEHVTCERRVGVRSPVRS